MIEHELLYGEKPMRWDPTRVHAISGGAPLTEAEYLPMGAHDMRRLLDDGYAIVVELQPGDATRYTLILSPASDGFVATRSNAHCIGLASARVWWDQPLDSTYTVESENGGRLNGVSIRHGWQLGAGNPWSAQLFEWWLERFRVGASPIGK